MNIPGLDFDKIFSFIISPPSGAHLVLEVLFIGISIYFVLTIIHVLTKSHYVQWLYGESVTDFFTRRPYGVRKVDKVWSEIMGKLKSDSESDFKLAVIEADSILDEVLKKVGYKGETLEDRLKLLSPVHYPNLEEMWRIHRIRNDIVRDPDYRLSHSGTRKILASYRKVLEDLEVF